MSHFVYFLGRIHLCLLLQKKVFCKSKHRRLCPQKIYKLSCISLYIFLSFWGNERRQKLNIPHHNHLEFFDLGGHDHLVTIILATIVYHSHLEKTSWGVNQSSLFKWFLCQNCMKIDGTQRPIKGSYPHQILPQHESLYPIGLISAYIHWELFYLVKWIYCKTAFELVKISFWNLWDPMWGISILADFRFIDLWGMRFHAVEVFGLGKNLLFKSVLGHCTVKTTLFYSKSFPSHFCRVLRSLKNLLLQKILSLKSWPLRTSNPEQLGFQLLPSCYS